MMNKLKKAKTLTNQSQFRGILESGRDQMIREYVNRSQTFKAIEQIDEQVEESEKAMLYPNQDLCMDVSIASKTDRNEALELEKSINGSHQSLPSASQGEEGKVGQENDIDQAMDEESEESEDC